MRRVSRLSARLVLLAGWLVLGFFALLFVFEITGGLRWILERRIAERLGPLGEGFHIESAALRWLDPALELRGVQVGPDGRFLALERLRVSSASLLAPDVRSIRVEVDRGRLVVSRELARGLREILPERVEPPPRDARWALPALVVLGLDVEIETAGAGRIPIGRVDASLSEDGEGRSSLTGRLVPSFAEPSDAPGEVFLEGRADRRELELRASGVDLPLSADWAPAGTLLEGLRPYHPRGRLGLNAEARWSLAEGRPLEARARLSLSQGAIRMPPIDRGVEAIDVEAQAALSPELGWELFDARAWTVGASLDAVFEGAPIHAEARWEAGGGESGAPAGRAWLRTERFPLDAALLASLDESTYPVRLARALGMRGRGGVRLGARLLPRWAPERPLAESVAVALEVDLAGDAGMTYAGFRSSSGERDLGFPIPVDGVRGAVALAYDPRRARPMLLGLVGLEGEHGSGTMRARGTVASPPARSQPERAELDIELSTDRLAVDRELEEAFFGLRHLLPPDALWKRYNPSGGALAGDVRLVRTRAMRHEAARVRIDLQDVGLTWSPLPAPLQSMRGRVEFLDDGQHGWGVAYGGSGSLRTAKAISIDGRYQTESPEPDSGEIDGLSVVVEHFSLLGDDQRILAEIYPGVGRGMDRFGPRGFADLAFSRVRALPRGPAHTSVQATAGDPVRMTPEQFKMVTSDVRGRVLIDAVEPPRGSAPADVRVETRVAPLTGTWGPSVQVAFLGRQAPDAAPEIEIFGAGIDPTSTSLLGSLAEVMRGAGAFSTGAFALDGRVDFTGVLRAPDPASELEGTYRFFLRDNRLTGAKRLQLDDLRGTLELREGNLYGERLSAKLATTPVALTGASLTTTSEGFRFRTRLAARGMPLDRDHLRSFVNEETLTPLLEDLELAGTIDIADGLLAITGPPEGESRIEFSGSITPHDTSLELGLPLSVDSASVKLERLIFETGTVRAWAAIDDLHGRIADRSLGPADLLVTYVEPRLSIESLDGRFEGGEISPLGGSTARGGTAFSIDLVDPFPFQLGLDLRGVELAGLLRGLFVSNIATRGTMSCQLRLTGDIENLLDLSGAGSFHLRESRLWSVPVFRALFSQLGLDDTAVFDSMKANVRVRDGVIHTNDIEVHSPLLQLVGSGTVDLDGSLKQDLEVRYSLLDYLGPLRRLFYSIQNRLVSVAIRGDLERPRVLLRSPFTGLFLKPDDSYRALPVPDFAPLPARF